MSAMARLTAVVALVVLLPSAGWTGVADPGGPFGFALISPERAAALRDLTASPPRAAAIRAADRVLSRTPHAMRRVHVEGTLPGRGIYDESAEALKDLPAARALALAGRLTGEARYVEAARNLLKAWIEIYRVSFNPIDETSFDSLFVAWDLLPTASRPGLGPGYGGLLRAFSEGYLARPLRGGTATNNWNSHRVKLIVLSALALGDADLIVRARQAYVAQLARSIHQAKG